jgi:poly-beta-1,6-N-acetyl-D-glucosamine synthase
VRAMQTAYVLVSPCKDEARYIERTLLSVLGQTIRPAQWIIVDDGSTDDGMAIVARYLDRLPMIKVVRRDGGARQVGPGVIRAFNEGLRHIDVDYDFICKFDVDLEMPPRYFETMLERMAADPFLGTCSGKAYYRHPRSGELVSELHNDEHSVGAAKFYRRTCFEAIGGFEADVGWDGYDCHRARWMGWRARSWDDPEIRFVHLRPMGSSQQGILRGRVRHGRGSYLIGTHPLYFLASALARSVRQRPYVIGTLYAIYGYARAAASGAKPFGDAEMTRFVRRQQLRALVQGRRGAAERAFAERRAALADQAGPGGRGEGRAG